MNVLTRDKQIQVVAALVEGNSIRATVRMTGVAKNTVASLLARLGDACQKHHDQSVVDLPEHCKAFQADEIHSFCYARKRNLPKHLRGLEGFGDVWTWTAICDTTRLVASWHIGGHKAVDAEAMMRNLVHRVNHKIMITTDGNATYRPAHLVTTDGQVDLAILKKVYRNPPENDSMRRYAPPTCTGVKLLKVIGDPDMTRVSTSYAERSNLTMRMSMRRFTRLTNGFSKKVANLKAAVALHFTYYNWVRIHQTLRVTPAMAAGLTDRLWDIGDLVDLLNRPDDNEHKNEVSRAAETGENASLGAC